MELLAWAVGWAAARWGWLSHKVLVPADCLQHSRVLWGAECLCTKTIVM